VDRESAQWLAAEVRDRGLQPNFSNSVKSIRTGFRPALLRFPGIIFLLFLKLDRGTYVYGPAIRFLSRSVLEWRFESLAPAGNPLPWSFCFRHCSSLMLTSESLAALWLIHNSFRGVCSSWRGPRRRRATALSQTVTSSAILLSNGPQLSTL
jgi:hypothetical protein